jgi:hypothetical protein
VNTCPGLGTPVAPMDLALSVQQMRPSAMLTACFTDHRDPNKIEHTVEELIGQRIYGLALGYKIY